MPDILLFGATGYTGRLTAQALADRGASFAVAGRDHEKLEKLAADTGAEDARVAAVGNVDALVSALSDVKVLITCVGPFVELGDTAVQAALEAGVHYVDSTGEGNFIGRLISERDGDARAAGIAMAPAMGFDEVPGDLAVALAAESLKKPHVDVTYAVPKIASVGTIRSALGIITEPGPWIEHGRVRMIKAGEEQRWSPMPAPLGPRRARSFPLALGRVAPLHLDAEAFRTYVTAGAVEGAAMRYGLPLLKLAMQGPPKKVIEAVVRRQPTGPNEEQRAGGRWTILAEARSGRDWRNVTVTGTDFYGLTAQTLSAAAVRMAEPGYDQRGVVAPVQALGVKRIRDELERWGVEITTYAPI